ncbi:MAG: plasmid pRiA4b ORF-3 family protein [Cyanobacteria bacterium P01_D01_bin.105]
MEPHIYQLKVTLADSEPEVWRRVCVSAEMTLATLHGIIQRAMGWENLHDYRFAKGIGQAPCDTQQPLASIASQCQVFYYTYDFQSGWLHRIEIELTDAATPAQDRPVCIDGAAACPPENTGGVWGYDELLARLDNTDDPDYLDLIEKYSSFDPDSFDIDAANQRLSARL